MDLQEAFDAGFVAVKAYVDDALTVQTKALPDLIKTAVAEAIAALPVPKDGIDGRDGLDGKDGDPGAAGKDAEPVTLEQVEAAVLRALEVEGAINPVAVQVKRWFEMNPVRDGKDGLAGKDGADGRDGCNVSDALIDRDGHLVMVLGDGQSKTLGLVVGRDGKDGEKGDTGRDGLNVTDFDTQLSEDGRILTLSLENEQVSVKHELQLPTMIYRGVLREGETYVQGDTVTWAGSLWHCNAETSEKPSDANRAWTLAAKRGSPGKDAKS